MVNFFLAMLDLNICQVTESATQGPRPAPHLYIGKCASYSLTFLFVELATLQYSYNILEIYY